MSSNWIAYEPDEPKPRGSIGHGKNSNEKRKLVRAAAATSSASTRKATMMEKKRHREGSEAGASPAPSSSSRRSSTNECINASMAGKAFETYLWARMILNPDLHAVGLFLGSTEAKFVGVIRQEDELQSIPLFLRGMALKCMQKASMSISDPAADPSLTRNTASPHEATSSFAICLSALAGWEKINGDEAAYTIHMNALQAVDMREASPTAAGIISNDTNPTSDQDATEAFHHRIFEISSSVKSTIQKRCADIGTYISSSAPFTIAPHLDTMLTTAGPTPSFDYSIYNLRRRDTRTLLFLLARLANLYLLSPRAWPATYELSILIMSWRREGEVVRREWERLLTHEDLEVLALYHLRLGMVSMLGALSYAIGTARRDEGYFRASDSADLTYTVLLQLRTEPLLGTQFEEAALWSVCITTATADPELWEEGTFEVLRRLITSPRQRIRSFEDLEVVLRKYAYREVIHKRNCEALWRRVMEGVSPGDGVGLRKLEITYTDLMTM